MVSHLEGFETNDFLPKDYGGRRQAMRSWAFGDLVLLIGLRVILDPMGIAKI
jgi:hypothetical protein